LDAFIQLLLDLERSAILRWLALDKVLFQGASLHGCNVDEVPLVIIEGTCLISGFIN